MGKDKYGYKHKDGHYSKMTGNDKKNPTLYTIKIHQKKIMNQFTLIMIQKQGKEVLLRRTKVEKQLLTLDVI